MALNAQALWGQYGPPESAAAAAYRRAHIVKIGGSGGIPVLYVRREAAPLFLALCQAAVTGLGGRYTPYNLDHVEDDWGYASRYIRGTGPGTGIRGVLSNHAGGLAIDLNANTNPLTNDHHVHTDIPGWLIDYAEMVLGLRWGGRYTGSRRDPMHFEVVEAPAQVALRLKVRRPVPPPPILEFDMIKVRSPKGELAVLGAQGAYPLVTADEDTGYNQAGTPAKNIGQKQYDALIERGKRNA
jgi:hypothetical protein